MKKVTQSTEAQVPAVQAAPTVPAMLGGMFSPTQVAPDIGDLLPQIKVVYPIEIDGAMFKVPYQMGIYDGKLFAPLTSGCIVTAVAARPARRVLEEGQNGESPTYKRGYGPINGKGGSTHADYEALANDPDHEDGNSFVVVVMVGDGATLVQVDAFGVLGKFWFNVFRSAHVEAGHFWGAKLVGCDCAGATTKSKAGRMYLDPRKLTTVLGVEPVELTKPMLDKIAAALEASKVKFEAWCAR